MTKTMTVLDSTLLRALSRAWEAQLPVLDGVRVHKDLTEALASYARQCKAQKQRPHARLVACTQWELETWQGEQKRRH